MKLLKYSTLMLLLLCAMASCDFDPFEDEEALVNLEASAPFVRLQNSDADGTRTVVVRDSGQVISVDVVNTSNVDSDLMVDYSLGGSAAVGEIIAVNFGDATGGTLDIPFDDMSNNDVPVFETIEFTTLVDTLIDGPQTIELELTDVSSTNNANYVVGQGPLYRTLTITLVND